MKILLFDIETAPAPAWIWALYNETTSMNMVQDYWYCLCWSAKWLGEKKVITSALPDYKLYKKEPKNDREVMKELWKLIDEADVIMAHNAVKFDVRKINTRFIKHGITPPSPYKTLDTLLEARKSFSFMSNRLNDLGTFLKVGAKIPTGGFSLWTECMEGNIKSWNKMVKYCKQDVVLLEKVYMKLLPYIKKHPNMSINGGKCVKCGSDDVVKRGTVKTISTLLQRYRCKDCGGWSSQKIKNLSKEDKANIYKNI
jgi:DNA polymerase elongation subunit (family B)